MSLVGTTELVTMLVTGSLKTLSSAVEDVRLVRGVVGSEMMLYVVVMSPNEAMSLLKPELTSVTSTRSVLTEGVAEVRIGSARTPPGGGEV